VARLLVLSVRSAALRWWPAWLLVAGGLLALGTRFVDRDLVSYVLDEPLLQDAAVRDARTGRWADISVLQGTRGVRYGPAPLYPLWSATNPGRLYADLLRTSPQLEPMAALQLLLERLLKQL